MSFVIKDRTALGANSIELVITPRWVGRQRNLKSRRGGTDVWDGESQICEPLNRALMALGRDSALRRKFLRNRWQGCHASGRHHLRERLQTRAQECSLGSATVSANARAKAGAPSE
jgi:hypothetical protein